MKTVYCPVKRAQISGDDCLLICDVADKILKSSALPNEIQWDEEQCEKCKKCKYHADII